MTTLKEVPVASKDGATEEEGSSNGTTIDGEFIQYRDFQKYTEHLSDVVGELQSAIANLKDEFSGIKSVPADAQVHDAEKIDNSMIADLIAKEVARYRGEGAAENGETATPEDAPVEKADDAIAEMKEKYNNLMMYTKYLAETLDKSITHQDYIAEETNKIIEHNNYLAENMNKMIGHQDYLAENMNKMIGHQDYIVENLNDTINYQNYVAEQLDRSIDYSNMLAEEQNKSIAHQDYLAEKMNQMIDHQDYIVENVNNMNEGLIEEGSDYMRKFRLDADMLKKYIDLFKTLEPEERRSIYECVLSAPVKMEEPDYLINQFERGDDEILKSIVDKFVFKLDRSTEISMPCAKYIVEIVDSVAYCASIKNSAASAASNAKKTERAEQMGIQDLADEFRAFDLNIERKYNPAYDEEEPVVEPMPEFKSAEYKNSISEKIDNLINTVKTQYNENKQKELEAIEESKKNVVDPVNFTLINYIPERLVERWTKLSDERKKEILAESKMLVINNEASAVYFWNTRDLREKQVQIQKIEENVTANPVNENLYNVSDERLKAMSDRIRRNLGR